MQLYSDQSMLSFEGEQFMGQQAIYDKLNSFGNVAHKVNTLDAQPTLNEGIAVLVSGELSIEGGNPMMFTESFVLFKGGA